MGDRIRAVRQVLVKKDLIRFFLTTDWKLEIPRFGQGHGLHFVTNKFDAGKKGDPCTSYLHEPLVGLIFRVGRGNSPVEL
jgi:hypothetical protein